MHYPKREGWIILFSSALIIKIFSLFPTAVERLYATGLYPYISGTQRVLLGWIPFSIGDILYGICLLYLARALYRISRAAYKKEMSRNRWAGTGKSFAYTCLLIYVVFNMLWGLNYNRVPMATQLGFTLKAYSTANLKTVLGDLVAQLNNLDSSSRNFRNALSTKKTLFGEAIESYARISVQYPTLEYLHRSVKPSLFSYAGNYLGFTGYYNPFSGEAQANTTVPSFIQPFTTCHEIGHQLGYAKENEANFAGFLSARASDNPAFRYSVYLDMYAYSIRELYRRDSSQVKLFTQTLHSGVIGDIREIRAFYRRYENPIEPVIRFIYANYLKANQQPSGMNSYNEVVAMLVAYRGKYGEL